MSEGPGIVQYVVLVQLLYADVSVSWHCTVQFLVQLLYRDVSGSWHCTVRSFWIQFHISLSLSTVDQNPNLVKNGYMCFGQYTPHMDHTVSMPLTQENAADLLSLCNTCYDSWQKTHRSCQKISLHHCMNSYSHL